MESEKIMFGLTKHIIRRFITDDRIHDTTYAKGRDLLKKCQIFEINKSIFSSNNKDIYMNHNITTNINNYNTYNIHGTTSGENIVNNASINNKSFRSNIHDLCNQNSSSNYHISNNQCENVNEISNYNHNNVGKLRTFNIKSGLNNYTIKLQIRYPIVDEDDIFIYNCTCPNRRMKCKHICSILLFIEKNLPKPPKYYECIMRPITPIIDNENDVCIGDMRFRRNIDLPSDWNGKSIWCRSYFDIKNILNDKQYGLNIIVFFLASSLIISPWRPINKGKKGNNILCGCDYCNGDDIEYDGLGYWLCLGCGRRWDVLDNSFIKTQFEIDINYLQKLFNYIVTYFKQEANTIKSISQESGVNIKSSHEFGYKIRSIISKCRKHWKKPLRGVVELDAKYLKQKGRDIKKKKVLKKSKKRSKNNVNNDNIYNKNNNNNNNNTKNSIKNSTNNKNSINNVTLASSSSSSSTHNNNNKNNKNCTKNSTNHKNSIKNVTSSSSSSSTDNTKKTPTISRSKSSRNSNTILNSPLNSPQYSYQRAPSWFTGYKIFRCIERSRNEWGRRNQYSVLVNEESNDSVLSWMVKNVLTSSIINADGCGNMRSKRMNIVYECISQCNHTRLHWVKKGTELLPSKLKVHNNNAENMNLAISLLNFMKKGFKRNDTRFMLATFRGFIHESDWNNNHTNGTCQHKLAVFFRFVQWYYPFNNFT